MQEVEASMSEAVPRLQNYAYAQQEGNGVLTARNSASLPADPSAANGRHNLTILNSFGQTHRHLPDPAVPPEANQV